MKILFLTTLVMFVSLIPFVNAERECIEDRICAYPKDFIKHQSIDAHYLHNGELDYEFEPFYSEITFGRMADDNFINVMESDKFDIKNFKVDLRTGFQSEEGDLGFLRFIDVIKTPISIGDEIISNDPFVDPPIFEYETTYDYNGQTREVIVAIQEYDGGGGWKFTVDKETGIVLESVMTIELTRIKQVMTQTVVDTNMITEKIQPQEIVKSIQKIPDWVKNSMKWFVDGVISEDEMISALQFLIKEGIIKVD